LSLLEQRSFISEIPPFDRLDSNELDIVTQSMDIGYFRAGECLIVQGGKSPKHLYIIIKGAVKENNKNDETISLYVSQDSFDAMALLEGKNKNNFIVQEELICYLLPKKIFLDLIRQNNRFEEFYYQNLSTRINQLIEQRNSKELASLLVAKVSDAYIHPPLWVEKETSVFNAVKIMSDHKANFILIRRDDNIGIVTDKDLRDHVVLERYSIDECIDNIATYNLISMNINDFLLHALLLMTKHNIKHLLVCANGDIYGVLEQIDLLSFFSNHTRLVAVQIERATTPEQLKLASQNLTKMIQALQSKGVKIGYIMQLVSELNRQVFKKLYDLIAPPELIKNSCLLVMGSEGRGEQILKTDQDNAIILRDGFTLNNLTTITQELTNILNDFGYPPCSGQIMVNNAYWCKSLKEFKDEIYQWVMHTKEPLMNLAIFCDALVVAGDPELLKEAKNYLFERLTDNQAFFSYFAKPILAFETPLNWFANFIVKKSQQGHLLDIKKGGIFPIVHGVRSLALEYKIPQNSTIERIKVLVDRGIFDKTFGHELIEALAFMITLRLEFELKKVEVNEAYDNFIIPSQLNKLERDLLKDSLKIVNELKKFIIYHFKLNLVS